LLEVHCGLRFTAVEELIYPFTNGLAGFRSDSMTLVAPLGKISGGATRRWVLPARPEALQPALQQQLVQEGLPFLQEMSSLAALGSIFHPASARGRQLAPNHLLRSLRGFAGAYLRQDTGLPALQEAYLRELAQYLTPPEQRERFRRLSNYLLHQHPN
jgi:hypothetical protein